MQPFIEAEFTAHDSSTSPRPGAIEQTWSSDLLTVSVIRHGGAAVVVRDASSCASFTLVLRGQYADVFDAGRVVYRPLSAVFHPRGLAYRQEVGHGGADVVTVDLQPRLLGGLPQTRSGVGAVHDLSGTHQVWTLLSAYANLSHASRSPLLVEEPVAEALHALAAGRHRGPLQEPGWMGRVTRLIETRVSDPLGLARLAGVAGVQPVYLTRVYRRVFGQTMRDTVHRLRTLAACRLLQAGRLSLSEVAAHTGFDDEAQLTAACQNMSATWRAAARSDATV